MKQQIDYNDLQTESPIEKIFAWECLKYLDNNANLDSQVEVNTAHGLFRIDFVLSSRNQRVAVECDGHDFHDEFRDEFRDAILLGEGHIPIIYHFRGTDIFQHTVDCIHILSIENPSFFSQRGHANLKHLCTLGLHSEFSFGYNRIVYNPAELFYRVWALRRDIYQSISTNPHWPYWRKMYKFASQHPGVGLDELISILDNQYAGRVP